MGERTRHRWPDGSVAAVVGLLIAGIVWVAWVVADVNRRLAPAA